ncbi:hypothetical protein MMC07_004703 [Pseudocyphellaria aurata]|nr:hypothetical protein [Pseudocyphellaria aurata]
MCQVIHHVFRHCGHIDRWELVNPCDSGYRIHPEGCRADNAQVIYERPLPRGQPLCCSSCMLRKVRWIQQALFVMLIKLKAATMTGNHSDEELGWRFRTWRTQYRKEVTRMYRTYGYEPDGFDIPRNVAEDEFDPDWHFDLPQPEIQAQLDNLTDRILEGNLHADEDFWWERREGHSDDEEEEGEEE